LALFAHLAGELFALAVAGFFFAGVLDDEAGGVEEPAADADVAGDDLGGASAEDDEDGLCGVLGGVLVAGEPLAAHGVDPGEVALDELGEGAFGAGVDVALEEGVVVGVAVAVEVVFGVEGDHSTSLWVYFRVTPRSGRIAGR
jgi:hypothetical protein